MIEKYSHARTALKYGLKALGLKQGDALLLPDYICDVLLQPLQQLEIKAVFFPVCSDLSPDWKILESLITSEARAILMVHYFGQAQDIPRFQIFCEKHHLFLVEDNAHGHGGTWKGKMLGSFGDIGISSPRKNMGIYHGGLLYLKESFSDHLSCNLPVAPASSFKIRIKHVIRRGLEHFPDVLESLGRRPDYSHQLPPESEIPDYAMHPQIVHELEQTSLDAVTQKRRQIYKFWEEWILQWNLTPVFFELSEGTVPLFFPARTSSHQESCKWFEWGWKHRIDISSWPTLPLSQNHPKSNALRLWETTLCFPIRLSMNPKKLQEKLKYLQPPCIEK